MNAKEEAFMKDFSALLKKYKIKFNTWDEYGGDECPLQNSYTFEDYEHFCIEIDEVIKYLYDMEKAERRELKLKAILEEREKRKCEK